MPHRLTANKRGKLPCHTDAKPQIRKLECHTLANQTAWMKITAPKTWQITRGTVNRKRKTLNTRVRINRSKRDKAYPSNHSGYTKNCGSGGVANSIVKNLWHRSSQQRQRTQRFRLGCEELEPQSRKAQGWPANERRNKHQADVSWPLK